MSDDQLSSGFWSMPLHTHFGALAVAAPSCDLRPTQSSQHFFFSSFQRCFHISLFSIYEFEKVSNDAQGLRRCRVARMMEFKLVLDPSSPAIPMPLSTHRCGPPEGNPSGVLVCMLDSADCRRNCTSVRMRCYAYISSLRPLCGPDPRASIDAS